MKLCGRLGNAPLAVAVVLIASWQVTLRSEDPNGVNLVQVLNIVNGTGGDLSQYRVISYYLAVALQGRLGLANPPFDDQHAELFFTI